MARTKYNEKQLSDSVATDSELVLAINQAMADHISAANPHAQYNKVNTVNAKIGDVILTKSDIGLNNVDNTSDINKPISTATQTALSGKASATHPHSLATISVDGFMSSLDKTKLDGIATNANNYTHPSTHPATMIVEDSTHRFITDVERATWNSGGGGAVSSVAGKTGIVTLDKTDVGLGNVDNTSDINKPISTATQSALDSKLNSSVNSLDFIAGSSVTTPSTDHLKFFVQNFSRKQQPAVIEDNGLISTLQRSIYNKNIAMWMPNNAAVAAIAYGDVWAAKNAGTGAAQTRGVLSSTNNVTSMNRNIFSTGTTATGTSGVSSTNKLAYIGNTSGKGGFFFFARFALETFLASQRFFIGLCATNGTLAVEPSTLNNLIAIGKDSTDSTIRILSRSASALTKVNTFLTPDPLQVYDFYLNCNPGSNILYYSIISPITGNAVLSTGEITTNQPVANTTMFINAQIQSTAGTTAKQLSLSKLYLETNY